MYLDVVGAVAGEPIELVHDTEVHPAGGDEREHLLEPVTIRRTGRFPGIHELPHDPRAKVSGPPLVRLALGRDGEPFLGAAAFSLLPC